MPVIPIDFSNVESFDNLPLGKYFGSIDKVELRPASDPTKYDQLQVAYLVTDGEHIGRKQSEFLSLSPKAAFRLKKFFDSFGLADEISGLDVDDETNQLVEPDLVAIDVIFEVYEDPKLYKGEKQVRTRLVEVLDEAPAPAPTQKPVAAPKVASAHRVVAKAVPADESEAVVEDDTEDEDPEPAPTPVRRTLGAARPAAAAAGPARRTLR